jgi:heme exporter protein CcmD
MMEVPHLGFIVAAYAVTAAAIAAMIGAVWLDYRDLAAKLARLEARRGDPESPPR